MKHGTQMARYPPEKNPAAEVKGSIVLVKIDPHEEVQHEIAGERNVLPVSVSVMLSPS